MTAEVEAYPTTASYPRGRNFLVSPMIKEGYVKEMAGLLIDAVGPSGLLASKHPASSTRQ